MNNFGSICCFFFFFQIILIDRQRMGERLDNMSFGELLTLDQEMEDAVQVIRERKVSFWVTKSIIVSLYLPRFILML